MSERLFGASNIVTHGVALPADPDPNVTPPAATRYANAPDGHERGHMKAALFTTDGTSIDVTLYFWEPTLGTWVQYAAAITLLAGVAQHIDIPANVRLFPRLTVNVGNTKNFGIGFY